MILIKIIAITIIVIIDILLTWCKIDNGEIQPDISEENLRKPQKHR